MERALSLFRPTPATYPDPLCIGGYFLLTPWPENSVHRRGDSPQILSQFRFGV